MTNLQSYRGGAQGTKIQIITESSHMKENERRDDLLCSAGGCEAQPSRLNSWSV